MWRIMTRLASGDQSKAELITNPDVVGVYTLQPTLVLSAEINCRDSGQMHTNKANRYLLCFPSDHTFIDASVCVVLR